MPLSRQTDRQAALPQGRAKRGTNFSFFGLRLAANPVPRLGYARPLNRSLQDSPKKEKPKTFGLGLSRPGPMSIDRQTDRRLRKLLL